MISAIVGEILESEQTYEEALNIELLQLATLLVRNMTQELVDHRKVSYLFCVSEEVMSVESTLGCTSIFNLL